MKRLLVTLALASTIAFVLVPAPTSSAARPPLVLAFYYDWFDQNTWTPAKVPDMPVNKYASGDPGVIANQIQQAQGAGIDAFVVDWWGTGNPTDSNLRTILDQANRAGFKIAVDFDLAPASPLSNSRGATANALQALKSYYNHPAYLHMDGKPVVFFFNQKIYSVADWAAMREQVDPNHQALWIAEGVKESLPYLTTFDGLHLYSIGWAPDVAAELNKWPSRVRAYGADKLWVATVMPGNDDTRTHRADSYVRDRRGGDFYRETWRAAFSTYPDWIIITSWNEWVEGTMIEPSVTYGNLYLDITRVFAGQFKAGLPTPTPTPTRTPTPTATDTPLSPTDEPWPIGIGATATLSDTLRVRVGPSTDTMILGRLQPGATFSILARNDDSTWWQIAFPNAKQRGWVAAEFVTVTGDRSLIPLADTLETPAADGTDSETPSADASLTVTATVTDTSTPQATVTETPTLAPPTATLAPSATDTPTWTPTLAAPTDTATPVATAAPVAAQSPVLGLLQTLLGWLPFH